MMDDERDTSNLKNMVLAIGICLIILVVWNYLAVEMGWVEKPTQQTAQQAGEAGSAGDARSAADSASSAFPAGMPGDPTSPVVSAAPAAPEAPAAPGTLLTVETPLYKAVLTSNGTLREFLLKQYRRDVDPEAPPMNLIGRQAAAQGSLGFLLNGLPTWTNTSWSVEGGDLNLSGQETGRLRFIGEAEGVRIRRELTFSADNYLIEERTGLLSPDGRNVKTAFTFTSGSMTEPTQSMLSTLQHLVFGGDEPEATESQYNITRVAWAQDNSFSEETPGSDLTAGKLVLGNISWMSVMNNYFMGAVSTEDAANSSAKGKLTNGLYSVVLGKTGVQLEAGRELPLECTYFIGPKERNALKAAPNGLADALDYGMFSVIARPLVALLQFFNAYVHNYGIAIILMTIVIKALFWPLSQKSYKSMQQMKKLQPMMLKIREKYGHDKEALNRETMQLYKTYKVNPAGGCLPIVVQIPVFFGLYQALLNSIELRHSPFITHLPFTDMPWLVDLSSQDPFMITPLVMGASMFVQQKMSPPSADPTQAKIMMFLPLIFTVLFINFPAGLVVYWLTNNVISIFQQWLQLRKA